MSVFQTAVQLLPSYFSSFFPPNVGQTKFSQDSAWQGYVHDAASNGYALPNRFMVFFESPWLNDKFGFAQTRFDKRLSYRCWSVNIPSQYFSKLDRDIGGPIRRVPYTATFDEELTMQFYCSPDMAEFGFFKKWMDSIVDPVSRYVSFYDDFAKDSKATLLFIPNNLKSLANIQEAYSQGKLRGLRFTELYPVNASVNGGTVEWASSNKPTFMRIGFAFREAVDITTYDKMLSQQLQDLADIAANPLSSNLTKFMQDQGTENIGIDGSVIRGVGNSQGILSNSEVAQTTLASGVGTVPGNGQAYADGGAVKTVDLGGLDALQSGGNPNGVAGGNPVGNALGGGRGGGGAGAPAGAPAGTPFANNGQVSIA